MCAIHGILDKRPSDIVKMIEAAHHRGPDGNGKWNDDDITLGHNLLSITDIVSNSNQPWFQNNLVLVYNGEIYNYKDLGKEFDLQTDTDTEVLIKGLEKHGTDFIYKLDGMFAFACYNKLTKKLILARDSNGAKPFYYTNHNNTLAFSSEIKSLLTLGLPRKVSKEAFGHYYNAGLTAGYLTMFKGIYKLIPGEVKTINVKTKSETKFNINNRTIPVITTFDSKFTRDVMIQQISEKLKQAVDLTQMGRREIGLFLSAGMDSTSILYELNSLGIEANTFSTSFLNEKHKYNEDSILAKHLAPYYKANHKEVVTTQQSWIDNFDKAIYCLEEPRQGKSYSAYYETNKFLSENGITVTLTGDGGDELLAGYKHHRRPNWLLKFKALKGGHTILKNSEISITAEQQFDYLMSWIPKGGLQNDKLNDFLYIECLQTLSEDFLIRNDKLGMNFSMESRFPMMCNVFKDYIRSIPGREKLTSFKDITIANKPLLRKAYQNKLPENIINKGKSGWRSPTDEWIIGSRNYPAKKNNPVRQYLRSMIEDNKEAQDLFEITMKDVDERFLNNYNWNGLHKPGGPGIGLCSQKHLFIVATYCSWAKQYKMTI